MTETRFCKDCRHLYEGGLRGPGCKRTRWMAVNPVSGPRENMLRCEAERGKTGRVIDRLFHPDRLPCGPVGRHFELRRNYLEPPL